MGLLQAKIGDFALDYSFFKKIKDALHIFNSLNSLLNLCTAFVQNSPNVYIIRESVHIYMCVCVCVCS
jgi:hypothetical protein